MDTGCLRNRDTYGSPLLFGVLRYLLPRHARVIMGLNGVGGMSSD